MQPLLDAVADPDRRGRRAPEGREAVAHDPHLDLLVDREASRRAGRRVDGVGGHVAGGPVGLPVVAHPGRQIDRVRRLDAERAHVPRREGQRDVVLLRAEHRLALVRDLDGEPVEGGRAGGHDGRRGESEREEHETHRGSLGSGRVENRVDIAGVGRVWQGLDVAAHRVGGHEAAEVQLVALAQRHVE